jgi:hypothetical protein
MIPDMMSEALYPHQYLVRPRSIIVSQKSFTKPKANIFRQIEKSQIPSTKSQINSKYQYPMTETVLRAI